MTRCRPALLAAALALASACSSGPADTAPLPRSVSPAAAYDAAVTDVTISGEGFRAETYQTSGGEPRVDATFRAWLGATELREVRWVSERELRARVPAGLPPGSHRLEVRDPRGASGALDGAFTVESRAPPALSPRATFLPAVASVGQPVTLRVEITNTGGVTARSVRPLVEISGGAIQGPLALQDPVDVDPGATAVFRFGFTAAAPGSTTASAGAEGVDPVTGAALRSAAPSRDDVLVQPPSSLSSSAIPAPAQASTGQLVTVEVVYANAPGAAGVRDLQPELSEIVGPGWVTTVSAPGPCDVAGGGSCVATFVLQATAPGDVEVRFEASGFDVNSDEPVAAPRASATLRVQQAPALSGQLLVSPARASTGQVLAVTLEVENGGDVDAQAVGPRIVAAPIGALLVGEPPPAKDVPARSSESFAWSFAVSSPGIVAFAARAEGWDPNGAGTVTLDTVFSDDVLVESGASLSATSSAAPLVVGAGQPVRVALAVLNSGQADARVTPHLDAVATGTASFLADPEADATIAGGEMVEFAWTAITSGSGTLAFWPWVGGVDVNDGSPVAASDPAPIVTVERPARLVATIVAPASVSDGGTFTAAVEVTNEGEGAALAVSATLDATGAVSALAGPSPPPPLAVPGGTTARFEWTCVAGAAPATIALAASASGSDERSGTGLTTSAAPRSVHVQSGARLSAAIVAAPAHLNSDQAFEVRVRVENDGDAAALGVAAAIECAGCTATTDPEPAATDLPPGGGGEVTRWFAPAAVGTTAIVAWATGTDAADGLVRWATTVERPLSIEHPAALALAPTGPALVPLSPFAVEIAATNPVAQPGIAQAAAREVRAEPLLVAMESGFLGTTEVSCAPDAQVATTVAAGAGATFRWTCASAAAGQVRFSATVRGTDANDGDPLFASTTFVLTVREAAQVAEDPFGDGTAFSYVFAYDGHVFLGPSGDGRGVVQCNPDGTGCASFTFRFWRDTTEMVVRGDGTSVQTSVSENTLCADLVTLGAPPLCDPNTPEKTPCSCGPDYEVGRGVMGSVRLGPGREEWLVAMGRTKKRGDLNYAYMTRDTTSPLELLYADLYVAMPPLSNVENVISMAELNGRLYLGLQVDSADRPRMVILTRTPTFPGLDAVPGEAFATTFRNTHMAEQGGGQWPISQVDAVAGFAGRLFVANRKAVLVSTTGFPTAGVDQFEECTPQPPPAWLASGIAEYPAKRDVTPADRGVTWMVEWGGRLYLARNTLANVPELWAFHPRFDGGGQLRSCNPDRSDWTLVATNFGDAANTHLTALFASDRHLYVGFDDAAGVKLWRTAAAAPASEADFTGSAGCAFGTPGCEPVGGAGFGVLTNTRFFDARALSFGAGDQIWATVGSGSSAVRVYRIAE